MTCRVPGLIAGVALVAACATQPAKLQPNVPKVVEWLTLAPYASHEECVHLDAGDRLDYYFETGTPVQFTIWYREAGVVLAPVTLDRTTRDSRVFEAALAHDYCMTWQAREEEALLTYRVTLRPAHR